jgi:hypothetical protein
MAPACSSVHSSSGASLPSSTTSNTPLAGRNEASEGSDQVGLRQRMSGSASTIIAEDVSLPVVGINPKMNA